MILRSRSRATPKSEAVLWSNQTGLSRLYEFTLHWMSAKSHPGFATHLDSDAAGSDAPPLFTALSDQLGLHPTSTQKHIKVVFNRAR